MSSGVHRSATSFLLRELRREVEEAESVVFHRLKNRSRPSLQVKPIRSVILIFPEFSDISVIVCTSAVRPLCAKAAFMQEKSR